MLSCQSSDGSLSLRASFEASPLRYKDHGIGRIVDNVAARENSKTYTRSCRILGRCLPLVKAVGGGSPSLFDLLLPPLWNRIVDRRLQLRAMMLYCLPSYDSRCEKGWNKLRRGKKVLTNMTGCMWTLCRSPKTDLVQDINDSFSHLHARACARYA